MNLSSVGSASTTFPGQSSLCSSMHIAGLAASWSHCFRSLWPREITHCDFFQSCWRHGRCAQHVGLDLLLMQETRVPDLTWGAVGCQPGRQAFCGSQGADRRGRAYSGLRDLFPCLLLRVHRPQAKPVLAPKLAANLCTDKVAKFVERALWPDLYFRASLCDSSFAGAGDQYGSGKAAFRVKLQSSVLDICNGFRAHAISVRWLCASKIHWAGCCQRLGSSVASERLPGNIYVTVLSRAWLVSDPSSGR